MASPSTWNPKVYEKHARFVSDLGMPVVELLSPQPGERILDLGCGDGVLSLELAKFGCKIIGIDSSPEMIRAAKGLGLKAYIMDGHALPFKNEFDAVFSNAALHWMKEPERVIACVWRALKPAGRFVGEFGGYGNVATIITALESELAKRGRGIPHPWYFPRPEEYRKLLEGKGFKVRTLELFPRPTPLPGNVRGLLETFFWPYTSCLPLPEKQALIDEVVKALEPRLCDAHGHWKADYVRLRFAAVKPGIST